MSEASLRAPALRLVEGGRDLSALLAGVAAGDKTALARLYERSSAKLFGICVRLPRRSSRRPI